jgi:D-alanine-D-alanine ligase
VRGRDAATRVPVVVLLGGPSAEHDVSIVSGSSIAAALEAGGFDVRRVLLDLSGAWWWLPAATAGREPAAQPGSGSGAATSQGSGSHGLHGASWSEGLPPPALFDDPVALGAEGPFRPGAAIDRIAAGDPRPVVFIALHGPFGEDGTVQALLEAAGLAYTGSGIAASALGMDKAIFKRLIRGLGLPTVDWHEIPQARWLRDPARVLADLEAFATQSGDPRLMIKPARLGSSVGMTLAHSPAERAAALEEAFRFDTLVLAERYVAGARDIEVSVIGNDPDDLAVSGPGEIISGHEFYDYEAKYTPGLSETSTHAELPTDVRAEIRRLAADVYRAIGAEGFSRVDFLVRDADVLISEINTIPGFTPISLFPTMPAETGLDFGAVCRRIVELAIERADARARPRLTAADLSRADDDTASPSTADPVR